MRPSDWIAPDITVSNPATRRSKLDFPHPLAPLIQMTSPGRAATDRPRSNMRLPRMTATLSRLSDGEDA
jgi:hypothetical protein